jgi:signal transduction histidine kinase
MMGASVLKRESGLSAEAVRIAKRILVSAHRMEAIISDLLDLTKMRLGGGIEVKRTVTDAHELCARIVEELQAGYPGREIRLCVEGDGNGRWDASRLEQVVSNLVANALQHGPEDAPVTVASQGGETEWTLSVHNLGEAIPPEALPHLFDPLRRGHDVRGGRPGRRHLGIGLFIVREVVLAHGGIIDATSGPAEGTRFVVRLPRS